MSTDARSKKAPSVDVPRNPKWIRDELILALDLYMTNPASPPGKTSKEVAELSDLLNKLNHALGRSGDYVFRNPAGVHMKVMNFRRFDTAFTSAGSIGLAHGSKDDEVIWNEFASDRMQLHKTAEAIRAGIPIADEAIPVSVDEDMGIVDAEEGRLLTVLHLRRERSKKLIEARKKKALKEMGELRCDCCDLNFEERYGERRHGFIKVHHTKPVHALVDGGKINLNDLVLVCANCHRMIHRRRPWLKVDELRTIVASCALTGGAHQLPGSEFGRRCAPKQGTTSAVSTLPYFGRRIARRDENNHQRALPIREDDAFHESGRVYRMDYGGHGHTSRSDGHRYCGSGHAGHGAPISRVEFNR